MAGNFLYNQKQPSAGEGEVANFPEFLEKNKIFNEHPVSNLGLYHQLIVDVETFVFNSVMQCIRQRRTVRYNFFCIGLTFKISDSLAM